MKDLTSIFLLQPDPKDDLWEIYHANTKLSPRIMPPASDLKDPVAELNAAVWKTRIEEMEAAVGSGGKCYPTAPKIVLPDILPQTLHQPIEKIIRERASERSFAAPQISIEEIAALCRLACGENPDRPRPGDWPIPFRNTPSAGALYPLELYLLAPLPIESELSGPQAEVWHYQPGGHSLERIHRCDPSRIIGCFQTWPEDPPPLVALLTGVPKRQSWKYGARAYRYTLLEAGHAAQNLVLVATALGLHSCPIVGFYDDALHDLLDIDGISEVALYSVFIGRKPAHNPSHKQETPSSL